MPRIRLDELVERFYSNGFYKFKTRVTSRAFDAIPFGITDLLIPVSVASMAVFPGVILCSMGHGIYTAINSSSLQEAAREPLAIGGALAIGVGGFLGAYGLNHFRVKLDDEHKLGLDVREISCDEREEDIQALVTRMNKECELAMQHKPESMEDLGTKIANACKTAFRAIDDQPYFGPRRVKYSIIPQVIKKLGFLGVSNPFVGEVVVVHQNSLTPGTIAHEFAHHQGYMPDYEASLLAYKILRSSNNPYLRFSADLFRLSWTMKSLPELESQEDYLERLNKLQMREEIVVLFNDVFDCFHIKKREEIEQDEKPLEATKQLFVALIYLGIISARRLAGFKPKHYSQTFADYARAYSLKYEPELYTQTV